MEQAKATDTQSASIIRTTKTNEDAYCDGFYKIDCFDTNNNLKWSDSIKNVVTTVGKNFVLDTVLAGSGYTVTGPYIGLISNVSYTTGPVVGDTMASHGGWTEAGNTNAPQYTGTRKTAVFNAASSNAKSLSSALSFAITNTGGVKGAFLVLGTANNIVDNTSGTLYSAGLFTNGDKAVANGDTLNISYTASLS